MATQSLGEEPGSGRQAPTLSKGEELVTELILLLRPFCEGESGKSLQSMIQGHDALVQELSDVRTSYNTILRTLTQRQVDWDTERSSLQEAVKAERARLEQSLSDQKDASAKLDTERGNADGLRRQIQDNERTIKALIDAKKNAEGSATKFRGEKETMQARMESMGKKITKLKDEVQQSSQRYDASVKMLNDVQESLTTVRSFLVPLQGIDDAKRTTMSVLSPINRC